MKPCCRLVAARPPTLSLLSNTVTTLPASRNICAAASPLHPAPIMAIDFNVPLFPGRSHCPHQYIEMKIPLSMHYEATYCKFQPPLAAWLLPPSSGYCHQQGYLVPVKEYCRKRGVRVWACIVDEYTRVGW